MRDNVTAIECCGRLMQIHFVLKRKADILLAVSSLQPFADYTDHSNTTKRCRHSPHKPLMQSVAIQYSCYSHNTMRVDVSLLKVLTSATKRQHKVQSRQTYVQFIFITQQFLNTIVIYLIND